MEVSPVLAEQLRNLSRDGSTSVGSDHRRADRDPADHVARMGSPPPDMPAHLSRLARDVLAEVPSCLAVSIELSRHGIPVTVTVLSTAAGPVRGRTVALASLAIPLIVGEAGSTLVLRASAAGAFMLLADDLTALVTPGDLTIEVDQHLTVPASEPGESLAASLAEVQVIDRAVGMLIGDGWEPAAAELELRRRAAYSGGTVPAVAERLLRRPPPARPASIDSDPSGGAD
jgi:hypothetical protein